MSTTHIPSRRYAGIFDIPADTGDMSTYGVRPSNDAIGGCYGIRWYQYYQDAQTGEIYRVHCHDGEYGGKLAYNDEDETYRLKCYRAIVNWCHKLVQDGESEIRMSRNEVAVMQNMTHNEWLETEPGKRDGKYSRNDLSGGLVGYCRGIPIICDLTLEDDLPERD
jgi:hypothetical protein